jgi:HEAT repeat protein
VAAADPREVSAAAAVVVGAADEYRSPVRKAKRDEEPLEADSGRERFRQALASGKALRVARAAHLIRQHSLADFDDELRAAFAHFAPLPYKSDPSCHAKLALLEALDYGESRDERPFLRAVRIVQKEPAWGPPIDTAAPVRSRGIVALARLGHDDLELYAAELLIDPEPPVRQAALDALAHRGRGAALALHKLEIGDEDPMVMLAAMSALVSLSPEWGLEKLAPLLEGGDRELAAIALGQSRSEAALDLLLRSLDGCVRAEERAKIHRGIGMHRSDRALESLLAIIRDGSVGDAISAITALHVRRFDPGVKERAHKAAAKRKELADAIRENF